MHVCARTHSHTRHILKFQHACQRLQLGTEGRLNEHECSTGWPPAQDLQTEFVGSEGRLMHGAQRDDRGADGREEQAMRGYSGQGQGIEGVRGGPRALSAAYQHAAAPHAHAREHEHGGGDLDASQRDLLSSWDSLPAGAQRRPSWGGGYLAASGEAQMAACESRDWSGQQGGLQASRMMQSRSVIAGQGLCAPHGYGEAHGYRESTIADAAREAALLEFEEGLRSGGHTAGSMPHEFQVGGQERSSYSTGMRAHLPMAMTSAPVAQQQHQQHQQQLINASSHLVAGGAMAPGYLHHAAAMQGTTRAGDMVGRGGVGMGYGMRNSMDGGNSSGGVPANKRAKIESAGAD